MEPVICHKPTPLQDEQLQYLTQAQLEAEAAKREISLAIKQIFGWYGSAASSATQRLEELRESMSHARTRLDDVQRALNKYIEAENLAYDFNSGGAN